MINLHFIAKKMSIVHEHIVEVGVNRAALSHVLPFLREQDFNSAILVEAIPTRTERLRRYFKNNPCVNVICNAVCDVNEMVELYGHGGASFGLWEKHVTEEFNRALCDDGIR